MKISGIRSEIVALPADEPLADAAETPNATRPIVTLQIETDEGVAGVGVTYFGGALTGTLRSAVDELGALMVGEDQLWRRSRRLRAVAGSADPAVFHLAHSALDMALSDIHNKLNRHYVEVSAAPAVSPDQRCLDADLSLDRVVSAAARLKGGFAR
jgi:L-alanine-DL-glutamate epimerase-like enolase superfamily enzyme